MGEKEKKGSLYNFLKNLLSFFFFFSVFSQVHSHSEIDGATYLEYVVRTVMLYVVLPYKVPTWYYSSKKQEALFFLFPCLRRAFESLKSCA